MPGSAQTEKWARDTLLEALRAEGFNTERLPLSTLQLVQAQSRFEGYYGRATRPAGWEKSFNWGAIHAGNPPCTPPNGLVNDRDEKGREYAVCIRGYESPLDGARGFVRFIRNVIPQYTGSVDQAAFALKPVYRYAVSVDHYANALYVNAKQLAQLLNEPLAVTRGSVNVDTDAIKSYIREVAADWDSTSEKINSIYAEVVAGKRAPLPFSKNAFDNDYNTFKTWANEQLGAWLYLSDDIYDAAKRWHAKQKAWYGEIGATSNQTSPSLNLPTTEEPATWAGSIGAAITVIGLAGAAAYVLSNRK